MLGEGVQRPKGNCVVLTGLHSLAAVPSSKQGVGRGGKSPQHPTTSLWGWVLGRDTGTLPPPGIPSWGWFGVSIPLHSPRFLLPGGRPQCVPAAVMPTPVGRDGCAGAAILCHCHGNEER